jgi:protein involved in polysaccharide export with SLBB domain
MILGEANRPGPFQFPNEVKAIGIVELISRIGGFNDLASKKAVKVTRYIQEGGQTIKKVFTVNVKELMAGISSNNADKKFWIYPDDIIYIPERFL